MIEFIEKDVKKRELDKSFYKLLAHAHYCIADIFINENYLNLGLMFQKKALYYFEKFESDSLLAHTNKFLGLAYMGTDIDTAKYYLNRCLELDPTNRFHKYDVDKAIAYMLYYTEDYKDSAFVILRNNLDEIEHDNVRESYHAFLGGIFIDRKEYDSTLYHLEKSTESSEFWVRLDAINSLTILYDSIGDQEKKAYYESILSKLAFDRVDGEMERANIMDLYNEHLNRMHEIRKAYCKSEICTKVLSMESQMLTQEDFVMLLDTANKHRNNVFDELSEQYPILKKEDLYYLCLVTIELSDKQISSLFGVAYNSIRVRRNKICEILGISDKKLNYFLSTKFK